MSVNELLAKLATGEAADFQGQRVTGAILSEKIQEVAADPASKLVIAIINAKISGDINLSGVGQNGRLLTLQIINCRSDGAFHARRSVWSMLLFAKSHFTSLDIPKSRLDDLLIEDCRIQGYLEASDLDVSGSVQLTGSHFGRGRNDAAVELKEARIGRSLRGIGMEAAGRVSCPGIQVGGEFLLNGSTVGLEHGQFATALDLAGATVQGPVALCARDEKPFRARGSIKITRARFGVLVIRGADLDGRGAPSIIADGLSTSGSVMLGGSDDVKFRARGCLRFILARIGEQFELVDADIDSEEHRFLILDGARIEGDVLIGGLSKPVKSTHAISANNLTCSGRLLLSEVSTGGKQAPDGLSVSVRQGEVTGGLISYDCDFDGGLNIDHTKFAGISLHRTTLKRVLSIPDVSNFPDGYAHEDDALLSAIYVEVLSDIFMDDVVVTGGDVRFVGAEVRGAFRLSRVTVMGPPRLALVLQGAKLDGGVMIVGSTENPCKFEGAVTAMGARIDSVVTLSCVRIGTEESPSELSLDSARVSGDVILHRVEIRGKLGASGANIGGNFRLEGSLFQRPADYAVHATGAIVSGAIDIGTADRSGPSAQPTVLDGMALFDGVRAGTFDWKGWEMRSQSELHASDMIIERSLNALSLHADEDTLINLAGTTAAQLIDRLDDADDDGWGAGRAKINLDGFRYDRIISPSGRVGSDATVIRHWRGLWLKRQADQSSTQAARQLARVLHEQGLHDASRLILTDAFSEEGKRAPTRGLEIMYWLFGLFFGHGFSGGRALATVLGLWFIGTAAVMYLQSQDLLVQEGKTVECGTLIDPVLYAGDVLLPVVDLGEEKKCTVGAAKPQDVVKGRSEAVIFGQKYSLFGDLQIARFAFDFYKLLSWIALSLAIATWSGIFKRSGRA